MEKILKKIGTISSFASRYIGIIIIAFSCLAFFWRDGFAWMTNYTSVFLGVIMFGMGLTIRLEDFRAIFSRPKEVIIGAVAQYTIMPVVAWVLCKVMNLKYRNQNYFYNRKYHCPEGYFHPGTCQNVHKKWSHNRSSQSGNNCHSY